MQTKEHSMLKRFAIGLAALAMSTGLAAAADEHEHAAKHGGVVVHSGHHVLELVAKGGTLELYITGEDGPEEIGEAKATATVLADGKTEKVTLAPEGEVLKGGGSFNAGKGTTVVVSLTMPGHEAEQARFKLD
jgi:hypothetical protein